ncbi:HPr family phosphocarrier protein [Olsenella massiliensis]|uniref:HPr family phosphocarrier protein n=1 Tax=Olsenella massiliensis TaxID=1622075 RepID=UPI00071C54C7|nr:HPr family phosphocarrier protein [Olsenella massiliensis]
MVSKQVTVVSATGLHARPASQFVQTAKGFQSAVTIKDVEKGSAPVNAKSIMMILAAGLGTGSKVEICCDGPDEQDALNAILAIKDGEEALFGE